MPRVVSCPGATRSTRDPGRRSRVRVSRLPPLTRAASACASGGRDPPAVGMCPIFHRSPGTIRNCRRQCARSGVWPSRSHDHQLPHKALLGPGAGYRPRSARLARPALRRRSEPAAGRCYRMSSLTREGCTAVASACLRRPDGPRLPGCREGAGEPEALEQLARRSGLIVGAHDAGGPTRSKCHTSSPIRRPSPALLAIAPAWVIAAAVAAPVVRLMCLPRPCGGRTARTGCST
jgi:hypothetical protein